MLSDATAGIRDFSNGFRELGNNAVLENKIIFKFSFTTKHVENYYYFTTKVIIK